MKCPTYHVTFLIVDNNETEILSGLAYGSHVVLLCWSVLSVANCGFCNHSVLRVISFLNRVLKNKTVCMKN